LRNTFAPEKCGKFAKIGKRDSRGIPTGASLTTTRTGSEEGEGTLPHGDLFKKRKRAGPGGVLKAELEKRGKKGVAVADRQRGGGPRKL